MAGNARDGLGPGHSGQTSAHVQMAIHALRGVFIVHAHNARTVRHLDKALVDGKGPNRRREVSAVRPIIDLRFVHGDLGEQIINVDAVTVRPADQHGLGQRRNPAPHTVELPAKRIGRPDGRTQEPVAAIGVAGQVLPAKEHALGCAAAHKGAGDADLSHQFAPTA